MAYQTTKVTTIPIGTSDEYVKETEEFIPSFNIEGGDLLLLEPSQSAVQLEQLTSLGINERSIIVFYLEVLEKNGIGILVKSAVDAPILAGQLQARIIQEESPRLAHYLQVSQQNDSDYVNTDEKIPILNFQTPLIGKIQYFIAQRQGQFFAIIAYFE